MKCLRKIIPYELLTDWRASIASANRPLVVTNGCFDLVHPGHLLLLDQARGLGNCLLVGVTGDEAIRNLKGPGRPAVQEHDRVLFLAALEAVSAVCLFPETDATEFLRKTRPDIYVKGGDYTIDTINQKERNLLEELSVKIQFMRFHEGHSSTRFLQKLQKTP
jgi:D-glycero-beta-D-manno-heptose 1-phosphate adenylyltransferase